MTRRYTVDEGNCIGCGLCHERAPENFEVPEGDMVARVTRQPAAASEEEACEEASEYCPTDGIRLLEDEGEGGKSEAA